MGNETFEITLPAMISYLVKFLSNSTVVAIATLVTLLGFAGPIIMWLINFFKNSRALVKQHDSEFIPYLFAFLCEVFMAMGSVYIYMILFVIQAYTIELTQNISNKFAYALFLIILFTMTFLFCVKYRTNKRENSYCWIGCNIIFFVCVFSFCIGGITENFYEKDVTYIRYFVMTISLMYSLIILLHHEKEGGIFLCKGNTITVILSILRYVIFFMYLNYVLIFNKFIDASVWIVYIWVVIAYINWFIKLAKKKEHKTLVLVETDFGNLFSTNNIKKGKKVIFSLVLGIMNNII